MPKRTVADLDVRGLRVLIRADLNVPLDSDGAITDDRRITEFLPTLQNVLERGGSAILMSHLGRPKGDPARDAGLSLRPVARRIGELTASPTAFAEDCVGPAADAAVAAVQPGQTLVLENLRFHAEETLIDQAKKNPDGKLTPEQDARREAFARQLARHGELYVNDAFGTCHRNHVSMYDVPRILGPGRRAIGLLVRKELRYLGEALQSPQRPFVAVLGGAKVSDKIGVIRNLIPRVDHILVGGAMTYTFWKAKGLRIGRSLCEDDKLELARALLAEAGDRLHLPIDSVAAPVLKLGAPTEIIEGDLPDHLMGLDIGPQTLSRYVSIVSDARTIVWNGPVGAFETQPFDTGTCQLAMAIAQASDHGATSIIGGGDSAAAVEQFGLAQRMTHISTGGGASLKFLEGKKFDPIEIIDDQ